MNNMVHLGGVTKVFWQGRTEVHALRGVSLRVPVGEFLTVVGPSGCGKSTLLHLVGGLDSPTSGEIHIGGQAVSRMTDDQVTLFRRRHIGFVFQLFHLLPMLTVEENVALPLLLDGRRMGQVRPKVEELLDGVGLGHRRKHRTDELSGGEMQRVAIARALIVEPLLLLADEPTGSLDSKTGEQVLELMRSVVRNRGHTTILVTHDPRVAACGDRTITMKDGDIVGETGGSVGATARFA